MKIKVTIAVALPDRTWFDTTVEVHMAEFVFKACDPHQLEGRLQQSAQSIWNKANEKAEKPLTVHHITVTHYEVADVQT